MRKKRDKFWSSGSKPAQRHLSPFKWYREKTNWNKYREALTRIKVKFSRHADDDVNGLTNPEGVTSRFDLLRSVGTTLPRLLQHWRMQAPTCRPHAVLGPVGGRRGQCFHSAIIYRVVAVEEPVEDREKSLPHRMFPNTQRVFHAWCVLLELSTVATTTMGAPCAFICHN